MVKHTLACVLALGAASLPAAAQAPGAGAGAPRVITRDIDTFWAAYDSAAALTDSAAQVDAIRRLYVERGSPGVRAFMQVREYTAEGWVGAIRRYPRFWASIRPATLGIRAGMPGLERHLDSLQALYPPLRPATIYFTVGALASAGTTQDSTVLIGAELAAGGPETDISEFSPGMRGFLQRYYGTRPRENLVPLAVHEYVHTQQRGIGRSVLSRALREGSADWIMELVTGVQLPLPYMTRGPAMEARVRESFRAQMLTPLIGNWFYNQVSDDPAHVPDLGYYMGYVIARAYYERAPDKGQALREMLEMDFDDEAAAEAFLRRSGYFAEPWDRAALLRAYEAARPTVVRVVPSVEGGALVDPATTELRFEFSREMSPATGTDFGPGGREQFPVTGRTGWSADGRAYTYQVKLEPGRTYGLVLEGSAGGGFRARDGYPLQPLTVVFTTAPARP